MRLISGDNGALNPIGPGDGDMHLWLLGRVAGKIAAPKTMADQGLVGVPHDPSEGLAPFRLPRGGRLPFAFCHEFWGMALKKLTTSRASTRMQVTRSPNVATAYALGWAYRSMMTLQ